MIPGELELKLTPQTYFNGSADGLEFHLNPRAQRPVTVHAILDFDGTITTADTTSQIVSLGSSSNSSGGASSSSLSSSPSWDSCKAAYAADLEAHKKTYNAPSPSLDPLAAEIAFQRSLRSLEAASAERCAAAALFRNGGAARHAAEGARAVADGVVGVTAGFGAFVGAVRQAGGRWGIVSVSWSEAFLRGVVGAALRGSVESAGEGENAGLVVLANRVDAETGRLVGPCEGLGEGRDSARGPGGAAPSDSLILTSSDKLSAMKSLLRTFQTQPQSQSQSPYLASPVLVTLYIGDSRTDIECLLDADLGIVMAGAGVMAALRRCGVAVCHVSCCEREREREDASALAAERSKRTRMLWWARDFGEVLASPLLRELLCL